MSLQMSQLHVCMTISGDLCLSARIHSYLLVYWSVSLFTTTTTRGANLRLSVPNSEYTCVHSPGVLV